MDSVQIDNEVSLWNDGWANFSYELWTPSGFISLSQKRSSSGHFEWYDDNSLCIVVCSKGYPENYEKNIPIDNLDKILLKSNEFIFHAGTKNIDNKIVSNGGRVLNFVVRSKNFKKNRDRAINLINQVNWVNGFFRSDIAHKVINEWE